MTPMQWLILHNLMILNVTHIEGHIDDLVGSYVDIT